MRIALLAALALSLATLHAQTAAPAAEEPAAAAVHVDAARAAAGRQWSSAVDFFCPANAGRANAADDPPLEPAKIFDNLYVLGRSTTAVFALTTPQGIILLDSGYGDQLDSLLIPGLTRLGLDPARVKYIIVTHGHADHFGGAGALQQRYGARVAMAALEWDAVERSAARAGGPPAIAPPKRDVVAVDGQALEFGGVQVMPVLIPGHTPGSLGLIFPVQDGGVTHMAALFGGTVLLPGRMAETGLQQYLGSIRHFAEVTARMNVDVELQNHPIYDDIVPRLAQLKARPRGAANPFVVGTTGYQHFMTVMRECAEAQLARRPPASPTSPASAPPPSPR